MTTENPKTLQIGDEIVSGVKLKACLRGHEAQIGRIAWSKDGSKLASPSADGTVRIWDGQAGFAGKIILDDIESCF